MNLRDINTSSETRPGSKVRAAIGNDKSRAHRPCVGKQFPEKAKRIL
jgi:hypothetical protein